MRKRLLKRLLLALLLLVALTACALPLLAQQLHYPADAEALAALAPLDYTQGGDLLLAPADPAAATTGLIFYPGALVDHRAYAPLLQHLADAGWLCISVKMPCYMAFTDINAATDLMAAYPQVERWYIGGHSLGGAMAASYAAGHADELAGLVLLASYSAADLRDSDLQVCSIYGSRDTVLSKDSYAANAANLPTGSAELVLIGGNHAGFGAYGPQKGDGSAAITAAEQQLSSAEFILRFCN